MSRVQKQVKEAAPADGEERKTNDPKGFAVVKSKLDLAWGKIEDGLQQEAEGHKLWIEGTLELINILDDARNRFPSDKEFGAWLTDNGYGENRIKRNDRRALLNMAEHPQHTREVLNQTHRRSWRLIWEEEIQPLLHSAVQPAEGESPKANPANNPEQPAEPEKKPTRRPRKGNGTKKPRTEWGKDLKDFMSDGVLAANALIRIKNSILGCSPEKRAELLEEKVTPKWSEKIDEGSKAGAWICNWANRVLDEEANSLIQQGRVVRTPARASKQVQPEA
jgi:hypothetical protein